MGSDPDGGSLSPPMRPLPLSAGEASRAECVVGAWLMPLCDRMTVIVCADALPAGGY